MKESRTFLVRFSGPVEVRIDATDRKKAVKKAYETMNFDVYGGGYALPEKIKFNIGSVVKE